MIMEYWLAQDTVKQYVCARCWGPLIAKKKRRLARGRCNMC